jgi:hypothetical protein
MATDFESYPKHRLENKGKAIQQILDVSSDTFGMLYDSTQTSFPSLQKIVGGAEHLQRGTSGTGSTVFFNDQLEVLPEDGIINVFNSEKSESVPVAIGNFITSEEINALFSEVPVIESLEFEPTIKGELDTDTLTITIPEVSMTPDEPVAFIVDTIYANTEVTTQTYLQDTLVVQELTGTYVGEQRCALVKLGDNVYTKDSDPTYLYQYFPGIPNISMRDEAVEGSNAAQFILQKPAVIPTEKRLFPDTISINNTIKYYKVEVNTSVIVDATINSINDDTTLVEVNPKFGMIAWIEPNITNESYDVATEDNNLFIFSGPKVVISNFENLPESTMQYNAGMQRVTITLPDLSSKNLVDSDTPHKLAVKYQEPGEAVVEQYYNIVSNTISIYAIPSQTVIKAIIKSGEKFNDTANIKIKPYNDSAEVTFTCP